MYLTCKDWQSPLPRTCKRTQDVATFSDTDAAAVPADFTATINWPGGGTNAGIITEDASDVFHVTGTHTFTSAGVGQAITVTIKDSNGTLYQRVLQPDQPGFERRRHGRRD